MKTEKQKELIELVKTVDFVTLMTIASSIAKKHNNSIASKKWYKTVNKEITIKNKAVTIQELRSLFYLLLCEQEGINYINK